jgi:quercetin dioxygenase-like cupin family protein
MDTIKLADHERFDPAKMTKTALFESEHMFFDLYGLLPGQAQKVHAHAESDKVYLTLKGAPILTVGDDERVLAVGEAAIARAGEAHGVRNDGPDPALLLVTMAPPPR